MITLGVLALIFVATAYAACVVAGREDDLEEARWRERNEL